LGLEHNRHVLRNRPRNPTGPLLERTAQTFLFVAGGLWGAFAGVGVICIALQSSSEEWLSIA
ncbi:MAG: hypothetical protein ACK557_19505, partial [Planctomycetota bacterium]